MRTSSSIRFPTTKAMEPFQSFCDKIRRNQVLSTPGEVILCQRLPPTNRVTVLETLIKTGGPYGVCGFLFKQPQGGSIVPNFMQLAQKISLRKEAFSLRKTIFNFLNAALSLEGCATILWYWKAIVHLYVTNVHECTISNAGIFVLLPDTCMLRL